MKNEKNYYAVLGVPQTATTEQIKEAYKKNALTSHPDKHPSQNSVFQEMKNAYDVLNDDTKREIYDLHGSIGLDLLSSENNGLAKKRYTPDQIQMKLQKMNNLTRLQWFNENVNLHGSTEIKFSLSKFLDPKNSRKIFEMTGFRINQRIKIPLITPPNAIHISTEIVTEAGKGAAAIVFEYRHQFFKMITMFCKGIFSESGSKAVVGLKYYLGQHTELRQSLIYSFGLPICDMNVTVIRKLPFGWPLNTDLSGWMTIIFGLRPGLQTGLNKQTKNFSASLGIEVYAQLLRMYVSLTCMITHNLWLSTSLFMDNPLSWQISVGGGCNLSKFSKVDFSVELSLKGIDLILGITRWGQSFRFPVSLFPIFKLENALSALVYSFFGAICINALLFDQFIHKKKIEKQEKKKLLLEVEHNEATLWLQGMKNSINIRREDELNNQGLIILHASYGNIGKRKKFSKPMSDNEVNWSPLDLDPAEAVDQEILNVTDPLQYQVDKSALHLNSNSKSTLPGFYDPCTGFPNYLDIIYYYKGVQHRVIITDTDELHIPPNE